jgi:hypothetical protein
VATGTAADTPLTTFAAAARARGIVGAAPAVVQTVALTTSLNVVYTSVAGNTTVDATMCPGVSAPGPARAPAGLGGRGVGGFRPRVLVVVVSYNLVRMKIRDPGHCHRRRHARGFLILPLRW